MAILPNTERLTIHSAVRKGSIEDVKRMLANGANINEFDSQSFTPLHFAAIVGELEVSSEWRSPQLS